MALLTRFSDWSQALWIVLLGIATPCYSVVTICRSSGGASRSTGSGIPVTTVMRRMLASIKSVEEVLGGGLLLLRHYHSKNRDSGMVVCKLLILLEENIFFLCD